MPIRNEWILTGCLYATTMMPIRNNTPLSYTEKDLSLGVKDLSLGVVDGELATKITCLWGQVILGYD